jgi:2-keto-4-pentenoate hydratase/2-oxohepta-3-ene-1,7-dioic acid hydratase in catechol pathway
VIGWAGTNLSPTEARDHIAGYTIFNDWSARDLQRREMRVSLGPAKGKDFATTLARRWSPPTSWSPTAMPRDSCAWR